MQRIGKDFFIRQMAMNMMDGETHIACELPGGAWILGCERHADIIKSMDQVQGFPKAIQTQVERWLQQVKGDPALAKPQALAPPADAADRTADLVNRLNPDMREGILEMLQNYVNAQEESLAQGAHPNVNSHADGYGQAQPITEIDPQLQEIAEASGGQVVINEMGRREWKASPEFQDDLGGGDSPQGRVNPGRPDPQGSGAEQFQAPGPRLEQEVAQLQ